MVANRSRTGLGLMIAVAGAIALSGCTGAKLREIEDVPGEGTSGPVFKDEYKKESIFGSGGLTMGGRKEIDPGAGGAGLGVNSFLWRATLDTISFMPVNSADPFGGVIITDWHTQPEAPNERFKLNIYILGRALRADGVKVAVFRQISRDGAWNDSVVPKETAGRIEEAILMRARQLRHETLNQ